MRRRISANEINISWEAFGYVYTARKKQQMARKVTNSIFF